jgi:predicted DNA-binding protein (UPF0251 family)/predicted Fe-Mo cluster-binding NifX family protein
MPCVKYYKPAGIPLRFLDEVCLSIEELESVRLKDLEDLDQEQCARRMNISRQTFQRVLGSARRKIAEALLKGKAIRIEGGVYELESPQPVINNLNIRRKNNMKIAVVTDDELTICQHFGRASLYMVFTIQDGKITGKEKRPKMGHSHFAAAEGSPHEHSGPHGFDAASQQKHASMAETIADCQVLITGGMGRGAYESLKSYNIEPVITDINNIDDAVKLQLEGKLPNLVDKLH